MPEVQRQKVPKSRQRTSTNQKPKKKVVDKPSVEQLKSELKRINYQKEYFGTLRNTVVILITAAAVVVLIAVIWMPILEIIGSSMNPTLKEGEYVVTLSMGELERGDLVAYYYGNKLLVKRCIGLPGDVVNIFPDGSVSVNNELLDEPYVEQKALGITDREYPLEVPQEQYFMMGDQRTISIDSRDSSMGFIGEDQIVGRVVFRIWPLERFGQIGES